MKTICNISIILLFLSSVTCPLAKTIYYNPDLGDASGKFSGFSIEFKGVETPPSTLWALCDWEMDLTNFRESYPDARSDESFGGFQTTGDGKRMLLTLSDVLYSEDGEKKTLKAEKIYPKERDNLLTSFEWKTNTYYKFVIRTWTDDETQKTFLGEWIQDMDTQKWYLVAYYNTNIEGSFLTGTLSQFQQNFFEKHFGKERSFNIRNIYAYDIELKKWISFNQGTLTCDIESWGFNTAGTHDLGFTDDYIYGSSGEEVEDQEKYDDVTPTKLKGSINQTEIIKKDNLKFSLGFDIDKNRAHFSWKTNDGFMLPYKYILTLYKIEKAEMIPVFKKDITRPEQREFVLEGRFVEGMTYRYTLGVYGLLDEFGIQSLTKTIPKSS